MPTPEEYNAWIARIGDEYSSRLQAVITKRVFDPHLAEDLVPRVLLKIWNKRDKYYPLGARPLEGVLVTTAVNTAVSAIRAKLAAERKSKVQLSLTENTEGKPRVEPVPEPDYDAHPKETLAEKYEAAVMELSAYQAQVMELTAQKGMTPMEIAELLGKPVGAVKNALSEARRKMAPYLRPRGPS